MAGQIAGLVSKEQSCHDIIQDYINECKEIIKINQKFVD